MGELGERALDPREVGHLLSHVFELGGGERANVGAAAVGVDPHLEQLVDLTKGEPELLCAANEADPADHLGRVLAVAAGAPPGLGYQTLALVEAECLDADPCFARQLTDRESCFLHDRSVQPVPWYGVKRFFGVGRPSPAGWRLLPWATKLRPMGVRLFLTALIATNVGCSDCGGSPAARPANPTPHESSEADDAWVELAPPAGAGALGIDLRADGAGVVATWLDVLDAGGHAIRLATLAGDQWSEPITIAEGPDLVANWADFPRSAMGGDDARYVHGLHRSGESPYAYEIQLYRLDDGTVESLGVMHRDSTPTEHGFVSMVPTTDGVRLFWLDGRAQVDGGPTALYTTTAGSVIETAELLDDRVCDCCQTDAAVTGMGPLVTYRDRSADERRDIAVAGLGTGVTSVHEDGWQIAGCPVNGPAVGADTDRVAVAWFTGADGGSVRLAFSDDGGTSFGEPIVVDGGQPPGRVDVALVERGAVVSWLARAGGGGEVRVRFVGFDGRLGEPSGVGSTVAARASGFPVLAVDGARLLVGYRDGREPATLHVSALPLERLPRRPAERPESPSVRPPPVEAGDPLPAGLDVLDENGEATSITALSAERPLLLAFFARWCQPCREELATLEAVRAAHEDTLAVVVVGVDEGPHERAVSTARRWGFRGAVRRDAGAATALGVPPLPGLFLVSEGRIEGAWRGRPVGRAELDRALREAQGE